MIARIDTFLEVVVPLGIESSPGSGIAVFPNPTNDAFVVESKTSIKAIVVFDLAGRKQGVLVEGNRIDLSLLSPGTYVLRIELETGEQVERRIVKR